MKNILQMLTLMFLLMATQVVAAADAPPMTGDDGRMRGIVETHNAIESSSLRISLGADLHGFVEGAVCDFCETIRVTITPATKAYDNGVEVPLKQAKSRLGKFATVFYELDTKNVSAIRW